MNSEVKTYANCEGFLSVSPWWQKSGAYNHNGLSPGHLPRSADSFQVMTRVIYICQCQSMVSWAEMEKRTAGGYCNTDQAEATCFSSQLALRWWVCLGFALSSLAFDIYCHQLQNLCIRWCARVTVTKQGIMHQVSSSYIQSRTSSMLQQQNNAVQFQCLFVRSGVMKLHHKWCWLRACACWAYCSQNRVICCTGGSAHLVCLAFRGYVWKIFRRRLSLNGSWGSMEEMGCGGVNVIAGRQQKNAKLWMVETGQPSISHCQDEKDRRSLLWRRLLSLPPFLQSITCALDCKQNKIWWYPVHYRTESSGQSAVG